MNKLILWFFVFFAFGFSGEVSLVDFEAAMPKLTVLPKAPPVILSLYRANPAPGSEQALRITTKPGENNSILKYSIPEKLSSQNYTGFSMYIKSDTGTDLEIAFEDNEKMAPFENIKDYLPEKQIKQYWQKITIPLNPKALNIHKLKNIYLKINTQPRIEKEVFYIDDLSLSTAEKLMLFTDNSNFKVYDFDNSLTNRLNGTPVLKINKPGTGNLTIEGRGHYGSTGKSLKAAYTTSGAGQAELFLPILSNDHPFRAQEFNSITLQLKSEMVFNYRIKIIYQENLNSLKQKFPHYDQEYKIKLPDTFWHKIILPLSKDKKPKMIGILITIPNNTKGTLYLDDINLQ